MSIGRSDQTLLYWALFVLGMGWVIYLNANSPGTPVQDEIGHVLLSRSAWQYPVLALNLWGRPANTIFYMLPALGGLSAARYFSIVTAAVIVLLATQVARGLGMNKLFLIPLFLWFQPWFNDLSHTAITEVPFSLALISSLSLWQRERWNFSSFIVGCLPLIRHEGIVLVIAWLALLVYRRRWKAVLIAITPLILYNLIYYLALGRWAVAIFFDLQPTDIYGSGSWLHYLPGLVQGVGIPIIVLSLFALVPASKLKAKALVLLPYGLYLATHVILYRFGLFASGGYHLFLLPLATGFALVAALGFEFIYNMALRIAAQRNFAWNIRPFLNSVAALIVIIVIFVGLQTPPRPADPEGIAAQQAANWIHANNLSSKHLIWTHVWFTYYHEMLMTPEQVWSTPPPLDTIPAGTILIWDRHYSPRWGYQYDALIKPGSGWTLLNQFGGGIMAVLQKTS